MDLFQSDRKRQRISLEEGMYQKLASNCFISNVSLKVLLLINFKSQHCFLINELKNFFSEEENGVSGLMDSNNCIQYRVTGGAGAEAGPGGMVTGNYRPVVVSSGDNSEANHGATNTTALSNVQVGWSDVKSSRIECKTCKYAGSSGQSNQRSVLCDREPK